MAYSRSEPRRDVPSGVYAASRLSLSRPLSLSGLSPPRVVFVARQRGGFVRSGEIRSTGDLRTDLVPDLVPIYDPTYDPTYDPIYADLRPDIVPDHPISYPTIRYRTRNFMWPPGRATRS